jgi:glycosyltransferase involved in cell wall biosynthesis
MKVLHVIPSLAPRYGGPSAAIVPMVEALNRRGAQAEIAATDADGPGRFDLAGLGAQGAVVHLFPRTCSETWKVSLGLWRWLRRHAGDYDLLHVHALWSFSTAAACAAARRRGVPFILRPCGMLSAYTWSRSTWKKRLYWSAIEHRNLAGASRIHVTSQAEADEVARLDLPPAVVVPQGTDPQAWRVERRPDVLRHLCGERAGQRPIVLFLSRLHPKKGLIDHLLPAFARLRSDAFLAIAGGPDEHEPGHAGAVAAAVQQLGFSDRVALLGPVAGEQRWALFDGAAVFVLPSLSENFGIVVTEAMARGVPVVVSEGVQAADHVRQAGAGRVVPLNGTALAEALDELLASPQALGMGEQGRRYVRDHLSWDGVAAALVEMYRQAIRERV